MSSFYPFCVPLDPTHAPASITQVFACLFSLRRENQKLIFGINWTGLCCLLSWIWFKKYWDQNSKNAVLQQVLFTTRFFRLPKRADRHFECFVQNWIQQPGYHSRYRLRPLHRFGNDRFVDVGTHRTDSHPQIRPLHRFGNASHGFAPAGYCLPKWIEPQFFAFLWSN